MIRCVVSVDTRSANVARQSIIAGADIINDVSGGTYDPEMLTVAAEMAVPLVIMHMRGTPQTMTSLECCDYKNGVVRDVISELNTQLQLVDKMGIPRWMQIVDPGIGFAKTLSDNLELLKLQNLALLKRQLGGRTVLVGPSRKRFINSILTDSKMNAKILAAQSSQDIAHPSSPDTVAATEISIFDKDAGTIGKQRLFLKKYSNLSRLYSYINPFVD